LLLPEKNQVAFIMKWWQVLLKIERRGHSISILRAAIERRSGQSQPSIDDDDDDDDGRKSKTSNEIRP